MRYPVIIADPPVPFEVWGKRPSGTDDKSAAAQYDLMTWAQLQSLGPLIQGVTYRGSVLFLWICAPLLIETLRLMRCWGFKYVTKAFCWVKLYETSSGFFQGLGYWTRANTEDVFLCVNTGIPYGYKPPGIARIIDRPPARKVRRVRADVHQIMATLEIDPAHGPPALLAPNTRHSKKPEHIQDRIEQLLDGPYLELFARRARPGWACLGNEIDGLDICEALTQLAARNDHPAPPVPLVEQYTLELEPIGVAA